MKKTRKFMVTSEITISMHTEVMATSPAKAIADARGRGMIHLCHQCAEGEPQKEWVTSGELDGETKNLRIDSVEDVEEDEEES